MIKVNDLTLTYRGAEREVLSKINLTVNRGEWILICGPTGCGKSSLMNCLNGIIQHESDAAVTGQVELNSRNIKEIPLPDICRIAGSVFQNPETQISSASVESEIAFGLENLALNRKEMERRISQTLSFVGLESHRYHKVETLSGGQKQRLIIACALALEPDILFLDEPTSQLDPRGTVEILRAIHHIKRERALTVVLIEHRIEDIIGLSDRLVVMDNGRIVLNRSREQAMTDLSPLRRLGLNLPLLPDLFEKLGRPERPLSATEAPLIKIRRETPRETIEKKTPLRGEIREVAFRYGKHSPLTLQDINLTLHQGERVAIMGTNGAGKSTLLHLLAERLSPSSGSIRWDGEAPRIGLVTQSPDLMLFRDSVREEIEFAPRQLGKRPLERETITQSVIKRMGLEGLEAFPPFSLSRGQRLRVAIGSVLSLEPSILLLDEPTTGQDKSRVERFMERLEDSFDLILFCTHSAEMACRFADRVVLMANGKIIHVGPPEETFFNEEALERSSVGQTQLQKYATRLGVNAITIEEFMELHS